jgi:saccharopine dehydrogenase-like NADP-dependent oxidoreductase
MSAIEGARVLVASRSIEKADEAVSAVRLRLSVQHAGTGIQAIAVASATDAGKMLAQGDVVIACGAAGIELVDANTLAAAPESLKVAIDLNAVPPAGLGGVGAMDKAKSQNGRIVYGAIGVGGLKMKIHRESLRELFEANDRVLDTAEILVIGKRIAAGN